jgi:hypothetical protein
MPEDAGNDGGTSKVQSVSLRLDSIVLSCSTGDDSGLAAAARNSHCPGMSLAGASVVAMRSLSEVYLDTDW